MGRLSGGKRRSSGGEPSDKRSRVVTCTEDQLEKLKVLRARWVEVSQEALRELLIEAKRREPLISMTEMLEKLRVDPKAVGWDEDEEEFSCVL